MNGSNNETVNIFLKTSDTLEAQRVIKLDKNEHVVAVTSQNTFPA